MKSVLMSFIFTFVSFQVLAQEAGRALKWSGDIRLRHQESKNEGEEARNKAQLRARLGLQTQVNDETKAVIRVATGSKATSTNQQLGDSSSAGFQKRAFSLDLAYVNWQPISSVEVLGGKTVNPYFMPGKNQLIWDSDVTPEGASVKWSSDINEEFGAFAVLAHHIVSESYDTTNKKNWVDSQINGAQVGIEWKPEDSKVTFGASSLNYVDFKDKSFTGFSIASNTDNGTTPTAGYKYGFKLTEIFLEASHKFEGFDLMLFADSVSNSEADDKNKALSVGFGLGYGKLKFQWVNLKAEKDSLPAAFADGDVNNGSSTDVSGNRLNLSYKLADKTDLGVTYYSLKTPIDGTSLDVELTQLDLIFGF